MPEKYVRMVQDMYLRSKTAAVCMRGKLEFFPVEAGVHRSSALSPCLLTLLMDYLTDNVRRSDPSNMVFANDKSITC